MQCQIKEGAIRGTFQVIRGMGMHPRTHRERYLCQCTVCGYRSVYSEGTVASSGFRHACQDSEEARQFRLEQRRLYRAEQAQAASVVDWDAYLPSDAEWIAECRGLGKTGSGVKA